MRFEEELLSLTRNSQVKPQSSKEAREGYQSQSAKNERKKEGTTTFCFTEAELEPHSGDVEAERSGKGIWYPEEFDRDIWGCLWAGIARQALSPGETPMGTLCTRNESNGRRLGR